jgi:hypothetical protein
MMVLTSVARLFPCLSSVVLLVGSRTTPAVFAQRMAALAITSIKLQVCLRGCVCLWCLRVLVAVPLDAAARAPDPTHQATTTHTHTHTRHPLTQRPLPQRRRHHHTLQELELRFLYISNARLGTWLEDLSGVTELRQLRLLRLTGGATPSPAALGGLSALRQLRALEVLPGVYGVLAGFDHDMDAPEAGACACACACCMRARVCVGV